jgi:hypothetical protein
MAWFHHSLLFEIVYVCFRINLVRVLYLSEWLKYSPYSLFKERMEISYTAVVLLMFISYVHLIFVLMACLQEIYCAISLGLIQNVTLKVCRDYVLEKSYEQRNHNVQN